MKEDVILKALLKLSGKNKWNMLDNEKSLNSSDASGVVMFTACFCLIKCIVALKLLHFNTSM